MSDMFAPCQGVVPLRARLEDWMVDLLSDPDALHGIADTYGAPVNIQNAAPFRRNIATLQECVAEFDLTFLPMFARKANKCLTYVDTAKSLGIGIDTASHAEVAQCLKRGVPGDKIVSTAAIKDRALMELCVEGGVTVILDNDDEIALLQDVIQNFEGTVSVGLRLNGFVRDGDTLYSRFGFPLADVMAVVERLRASPQLRIDGLHFHLNGYSAADRIAAIEQTLPLIEQVRRSDQDTFFLDIGGGIPMNYLADTDAWTIWREQLDAALAGTRSPITQHNDGLGRKMGPNGGFGTVDTYPVAQSLVQTAWMRSILSAPSADQSIAEKLRAARVSLRCEPGRSVLDGCGITVARVAFCKTDSAGTPVIGVQMNRTQSRSGFAEFALDPLMVPGPQSRGDAVEGYLAGTYCTESEWLTRRKMSFAHGVRPGDLMVFPNTAGYLMHFLESRSHQFPLARNIFIDAGDRYGVDAIDSDIA